ncbi:SH3 domain-containing protein [Rubrivivax sp. RP6-9]|uniref:SH3 domain-containing protein n=1 Tax=Rubrivivax sp. RP6-9 TaxID=3415750 RepID=UPI003CC52AEF
MLRTHPLPALALAAFACIGLPVVSTAEAREMVSVAQRANMRAGAGTQHEALWVLEAGYPLSVTNRRGNWLKVTDFEGDTGWIYRPLTARRPHLVVKVEVANLRSAPSTRARRIGQAEYGEVLRTVKHRPGWVQVRRADGLQGWIARRLLWGW